ncbi:MAG: Ig-like domain-containing protein [bacterium]|nr:Ig-like domain-containing protein [bacterium]
MKNPKLNTLILIAFLSFLAGSLFVLNLFSSKQTNKTPAPQSFLTATRNFPSPGPHQTPVPGEAIIFTFNQKINPETLSFTVSPNIDLKWSLDDIKTTLSIYPSIDPWEENKEYQLTISKNLSSVEGNKLKEDLVYNYQFEFSKMQE